MSPLYAHPLAVAATAETGEDIEIERTAHNAARIQACVGTAGRASRAASGAGRP